MNRQPPAPAPMPQASSLPDGTWISEIAFRRDGQRLGKQRRRLHAAVVRSCRDRDRPSQSSVRGPFAAQNQADESAGTLVGAHVGIRTRDLFLTKEVLYRLSYVGAILNLAGQLPPGSVTLSATSC